MTCRQQQTYAGQTPFSGSHATEAECLAACQEGACCEGTTCSVKPQCQCQGTGKVFKGVGTVCSPNPCDLCDASTITISTSGTASGLRALWVQDYPCPDASHSISNAGSGVLNRNDSFLLAGDVCTSGSVVEKCGFFGTYSTGGGASATVAVKFFLVGNEVRYAARFRVVSSSDSTKAACGPPPFSGGVGSPVTGGVGVFIGCSPVVGTASPAGGLLVDLSTLPPFVISAGGSYSGAAGGGSVTLSFNPLP